jgi:acyl carrier protein
MKTTEAELLDLFSKEARIDRGQLTGDATLESLNIDSMDVLSVLFEIEDRFGTIIEVGDLPQAVTLQELSDYLLSRINAEPAAS